MKPTFLLDLLVKYLVVAVVLLLTLTWIGGVAWTGVLSVAVWVTVVNYFIGDLLVYRWAGNVSASLSEILLSAFTLWLTLMIMRISHPSWDIWLSAVALGGAEAAFHNYLSRRGYPVAARTRR